MNQPNCVGVVLAGGAASRFDGRAKGLFEVGGRRIVDRVLDALGQATTERIVVGKDMSMLRRALPGLTVIADSSVVEASLAGLHAALTYAGGPALVVAWDMPFVTGSLLRHIREAGETAGTTAIPEGPHGLEPLCAYYTADAADVAARQLARGELRLGGFVRSLPNYATIPVGILACHGDPSVLFANVNTPSHLEAAMRLANGERAAGEYLHARSPITEHQ